ncbi:hypothetical protein [Algoriphagus litoralis]|uniref:hypothetical protein n=1 Tax=Algoriphagus litoralis TaxID=2202829 RepID=UPI000DB92DCB|nr:hypothetical protein [Algoriphagus litoralis]
MQENQAPSLEEWVDSDQNLNEKTTELFESNLPVEEQAREALTYLIENYNLPEMPLDLEERDEVESTEYPPISIFEQIAQLKFANPENNDPRYLVLTSAYLIKHGLSIDFSEQLQAFLGKSELLGFGYRGEDILEAELIPVKKGESWYELGCTFFTKEVI